MSTCFAFAFAGCPSFFCNVFKILLPFAPPPSLDVWCMMIKVMCAPEKALLPGVFYDVSCRESKGLSFFFSARDIFPDNKTINHNVYEVYCLQLCVWMI